MASQLGMEPQCPTDKLLLFKVLLLWLMSAYLISRGGSYQLLEDLCLSFGEDLMHRLVVHL